MGKFVTFCVTQGNHFELWSTFGIHRRHGIVAIHGCSILMVAICGWWHHCVTHQFYSFGAKGISMRLRSEWKSVLILISTHCHLRRENWFSWASIIPNEHLKSDHLVCWNKVFCFNLFTGGCTFELSIFWGHAFLDNNPWFSRHFYRGQE